MSSKSAESTPAAHRGQIGLAVLRRCGPAAVACAGLVALAGLAAAPLSAQEGPLTFELSLSNPGARSMGLGGAFAALADDATAAFANPAGLVQLIEPEVSAEGRAWSYDTSFVEGGRVSGAPSGEGIDTVARLRRGTSSSDLADLSFLSLVYPGKRWSLAAYRHTWANFELGRRIDGLFARVDGEDERGEDVLARTRVEVINTGVAAAYELTTRLSFGVGVVLYDAVLDSFSVEYAQDDQLLFEPNAFAAELVDTTYSYQADDTGLAVHAGFLWRLTDRWSVGGFFREGPEVDLHVLEVAGPAEGDSPEGTVELDIVTPLLLPDVYGLGVAWRSAGGTWTVSFEWARVGYSSITDSLDTQVFDAGQIQIDDGDELRLGIERVFVGTRPLVALRLGAWRDPAHGVGSGPDADEFEAAIFQGGDDELHLTGGVGLIFDRFQVDIAADLSESVDQYSTSLVTRF